MPVTELQNQQGALGTILGLAGGYLAANPERKAKKAQQEYQQGRDKANDARADQEATQRGALITSEIAKNQASTEKSTADATALGMQQHLAQTLTPQLDNVPKGTTAQAWVQHLRQQANAQGFSDKELRGQFEAEAARVLATDKEARTPKLSDVEHGLPQLQTTGKHAATPEQTSQHYMQAAARALASDMPPDQKKLAVEQYQRMAAAAYKDQPKPPAQMTPYQQAELKIQQGHLDLDRSRPHSDGGRGPDGLTPYERITEGHWKQTHNPDGTSKGTGAARDISGMSAAGREAFQHDMTKWTVGGMDPESMPDPGDAKYPKKAAAMTKSGSDSATPSGKTVVGSDGHTYQQLPTGKWRVIK